MCNLTKNKISVIKRQIVMIKKYFNIPRIFQITILYILHAQNPCIAHSPSSEHSLNTKTKQNVIILDQQQERAMDDRAKKILDFWFNQPDKWFVKDPDFDQQIRAEFLSLYILGEERQLQSWENSPQEMLALIILLDQFPRNMFRNSSDMYRTDPYALNLTHTAINKAYLEKLDNQQQVNFMLMPLMHSEKLSDQELGVELFEKYGSAQAADYARQHKVIVEQFGRFPHRNQLLNRPSTTEELEFLQDHKGF